MTNFDNWEMLKKQKLKDILKLKRSDRYEKTDEYHNKNLLEEIKNKKVIKNILEENYLIFFEKVYYKGERKISLTKYGSDEILCLDSKTRTYLDKVKSFNDPIYAAIYDNYVNELYFQRKINFNMLK